MSEWSGWYAYLGSQYEMKFSSFCVAPVPGYAIEGEGEDEVGKFKFEDMGSEDG